MDAMWTVFSLQLLLTMIFKTNNCLTITKTATITRYTPNFKDNGATVITLDAYEWPDRWLLYSNRGCELQLTLNSSWGFHPTENTTLTIEVYADTDTGYSTQFHYLMLAFTQTHTKYFTTRISLNESNDDHRIYPLCQSIQPYDQTYATGNVRTIVDAYSNTLSQFGKASLDADNDYFNPLLAVNERHVEAPLTFILFNNPMDNYLLFTYTNPNAIARSCGYVKMDSNKEMNIYFAADSVYSYVDINSIHITHTYEFTTNNPTMIPTSNPTVHPTINPTIYPTINPTIIPTNYPTFVPITINPTINPSINPTKTPTMTPSLNPTQYTNIPSNIPTVTPTEYPTMNPSFIPTNNPIHPQSVVDDITTTLVNNDINANNKNKGENTTLYILIGSISGLLCIIIILIVIIVFKVRKNRNEKNVNMVQHETKQSKNNITEMITKPDFDEHEGHNEYDNDDMYDKVHSIDSLEMVTPKNDIGEGNNIVEYDEAMNTISNPQ
eukprot:283362_1